MERCLELAANGLGTTYPNPLVGAVVSHKDIIIGEGWHRAAGEPHAEVHAIGSVADKGLLKEATIYVNLEPCSHHGKTPPCADLIIDSGIKHVVVGSLDPNPQVSGSGIARLKEAGIKVKTGVLLDRCNWLNRRFFTNHVKKRPYVVLKWAESQDGFISPVQRTDQAPVWITSKRARQWAHRLRTQEQAILVGSNTARADNPSLTARDWSGNNPLRIVLDRNLTLDPHLKLLDGRVPTMVISQQTGKSKANMDLARADFDKDLPSQLLEILYNQKIQSVIIEGGAQTLQAYIDAKLWDEAYILQGPVIFNEGLEAPRLDGIELGTEYYGPDLITHYMAKADAGITI